VTILSQNLFKELRNPPQTLSQNAVGVMANSYETPPTNKSVTFLLQPTCFIRVSIESTCAYMKSTTFWDITPCGPLRVNLEDPEDGGNMFL
jgi:hypothetical protein